jgi:hypothetical protein
MLITIKTARALVAIHASKEIRISISTRLSRWELPKLVLIARRVLPIAPQIPPVRVWVNIIHPSARSHRKQGLVGVAKHWGKRIEKHEPRARKALLVQLAVIDAVHEMFQGGFQCFRTA